MWKCKLKVSVKWKKSFQLLTSESLSTLQWTTSKNFYFISEGGGMSIRGWWMLSGQCTCAPSQELSIVLPGSTAVFRCQLCQHEHYVDREALSLPYSASLDRRTAPSALTLGEFNVKLQHSSNVSFVHTHIKSFFRMRLVAP